MVTGSARTNGHYLVLERPDSQPDDGEARARGRELRESGHVPAAGYRSFGRYLRRRFGARVFKVTLHAGFTCPNRDGLVGTGGCVYCINESFSPNTRRAERSLAEQMRAGTEFYRRRYGAEKFFAYFQTFTNTYAPASDLKVRYDEALGASEDIVGLSVGTRPDCVPDETLDLLESYSDRYDVWVEYGLQSMHDETLRRINRGHGLDAFVDAVERTRGRNLHLCVHVILGLPGENWSEMMETARFLGEVDILESLKIHHLYVARGTELEAEYERGELPVLSLEDYVTLTCDFLERTRPEVAMQRIVGDTTSRWLLAPRWGVSKNRVPMEIGAEFGRRGTCQGARWRTGAGGGEGGACDGLRHSCHEWRCGR
jgi:radical SAM protein (TIGR01212 family)